MQTITFVFKCSNSNILEGAVGSKALCARRSWVIVMCSVGETFYSSGISPRLWNNWFFILEYSLVLAAIYLVNRSLKRFDLSDWSGVGRNILVYFRIILFFFYFFRLNRTLRHLRLFINGYDVTQTVANCYAHLHYRLLLLLVEILLQCYVSAVVIFENQAHGNIPHFCRWAFSFKLFTLHKSSWIVL